MKGWEGGDCLPPGRDDAPPGPGSPMTTRTPFSPLRHVTFRSFRYQQGCGHPCSWIQPPSDKNPNCSRQTDRSERQKRPQACDAQKLSSRTCLEYGNDEYQYGQTSTRHKILEQRKYADTQNCFGFGGLGRMLTQQQPSPGALRRSFRARRNASGCLGVTEKYRIKPRFFSMTIGLIPVGIRFTSGNTQNIDAERLWVEMKCRRSYARTISSNLSLRTTPMPNNLNTRPSSSISAS